MHEPVIDFDPIARRICLAGFTYPLVAKYSWSLAMLSAKRSSFGVGFEGYLLINSKLKSYEAFGTGACPSLKCFEVKTKGRGLQFRWTSRQATFSKRAAKRILRSVGSSSLLYLFLIRNMRFSDMILVLYMIDGSLLLWSSGFDLIVTLI